MNIEIVMYSIFYFCIYCIPITFLSAWFLSSLSLFADILDLGLTLSLKRSYNHWPPFIIHYVKPKLKKQDYFSLRVVQRH